MLQHTVISITPSPLSRARQIPRAVRVPDWSRTADTARRAEMRKTKNAGAKTWKE